MASFLVNGLNSKSGGGASILNNLIINLSIYHGNHFFYFLTPSHERYQSFESSNLKVIRLPKFMSSTFLSPLGCFLLLPYLVKKKNIDAILNLGDLIVPTKLKQVYLFDWSYAVYPSHSIWKDMDIVSYISRRFKFLLFKKYIKYPDVILAQTKTNQELLVDLYGLSNVRLMTNAVSFENLGDNTKGKGYLLPRGKKLLYLSYYYPHKNFEILLPLARMIKEEKLDYKVIVTISALQHRKAAMFLKAIEKDELQDVLINIGPVASENVPLIYKQCDALLMPSLLESFSGTYIEAMHHGIPIFTSRLSFARDVCGNAAFYFDPYSAADILDILEWAFTDPCRLAHKICTGREVLSRFPSWQDNVKYLVNVLNEVV